jgi:hypothetical protein
LTISIFSFAAATYITLSLPFHIELSFAGWLRYWCWLLAIFHIIAFRFLSIFITDSYFHYFRLLAMIFSLSFSFSLITPFHID